MKLSEHFELSEFTRNSHGLPNEPPAGVIPLLREFCEQILEPLRAHVGRPVLITSGYRSAKVNRKAGGLPGSYHRATPTRCAADIQVSGVPLAEVFRWLCEESGLPFDKVILERGKRPDTETDDCIHIQYRSDRPRRLAFLGPTHGQGSYTPVEVNA
ncbi:MAG TPA: D-Ala-D-Ala carboxypeptidase family metallohydrolase [Terriglobia bacterium]|nr:D-Ala-D-Ala carboxypeptidase family metallohydrolase [Terriglobia bacterium]